MNVQHVARRVRSFVDRVFVPREIHIRSNDRVRFIRLSPTTQKAAACSVLALVGWMSFSSASLYFNETRVAAKNAEIEQQKLKYFELLSQVGEYHSQFERITRDLQENQNQLLALLEGNGAELQPEEKQLLKLRTSETERARIALARQALEGKLQQFEDDLAAIAGQSETLEAQAKQLRSVLRTSEEEREKIAEAGRTLGWKLAEAKGELAMVEADKVALKERRDELENQVAQLNKKIFRLNGELSEKEALITEQQAHMAALRAGYRRAEQEMVAAEGALKQQVALTRTLTSDKENLEGEVDTLKNSLVEVSNVQRELIDRLTARSKQTVDVIEKTVEMTGLDLNRLIPLESENTAQGGPYIPLDEFEESEEFKASAAVLDMQLTRLEALQEVVAKLPLTAPLDQYRVTSSFGKRRDPVTGKTAVHHGLDMAAPMKSSIYAPAPGKVVYAGWRGRYGRFIEIDHGNGIRTRYGHLRKLLVKQGQEILHREKIALLGSSGRSTGPHVHYEILFNGKQVDPRKFLRAGKHVFKVQ